MDLILKIIAKIFNSKIILNNPYIHSNCNFKDNSSKIENDRLAMIGDKTVFYPESEFQNLSNDKSKIVIGKNTHIRGEILAYPYSEKMIIGDNCYVGVNTIIRCGEFIKIGDNVLIAHNVTIIDSDSHEIDAKERADSFINLIEHGHPLTKGSVKTSPIVINDNVWISYNVAILKGVTIGEGAIIAAGSIITKDVPPFTIAAGNPGKIIKN